MYSSNFDDDDLLDEIDRKNNFKEDLADRWCYRILKKKCECGAHAIKSDKHSDYCPLYTKD
jgi:hypothetical protein